MPLHSPETASPTLPTGATDAESGVSGAIPVAIPQLALLLALLLGGYMRLFPVLSADFPINDGGLFYLMTQELQRTGGALPSFTSYNAAHIPFSYPPFAFYFLAAVVRLTGWPLIDALRLLPAVFSVLTIPAFYLFCRALRASPLQCAAAVLAFALLPRSYEVLIIGGGMTRAPGFLWVLLALQQFVLLYRHGERKYLVGATVFTALTVLTHPTVIWLGVYSVALLFCFYGRSRRALLHSLVVAVAVLLLTAPWWGTVVQRHGIAPFLAASQTKQYSWAPYVPLFLFDFTGEPFLPVLGALGLLGLIVALVRRRYFPPAWLAAMFFLQPRGVAVYATVPLALLIGMAVDELLPLLRRWQDGATGEEAAAREALRPDAAKLPVKTGAGLSGPLPALRPPGNFLLGAVTVYLLLYAALGAFSYSIELLQKRLLAPDERVAMRWIAAHTPKEARFLVVTGDEVWNDKTSEWFPVLAQRYSVATIQGYEWLADGQFAQRWRRLEALQRCAGRDGACLAKWSNETGQGFTHVYICKTKEPESGRSSRLELLRRALRANSSYRLLYDGPGATIFALRH